MKKINTILVLLLALFIMPTSTVFAVSDDMDLNIKIDNSDSDTVVVTIPDDHHYEETQPSISVNTPFSKVKVEKGGEVVDFTITNGVVKFTIDDYNCDYVITKVVDNNSSNKTKSYTVPKTGIN